MTRSVAERMAAGKPEAWIAKNPGDKVIGEIESVGTIVTDFGPSIVTTILQEDGSAVNVAWFGGVLKNQWQSLQPVVGMTVGIEFLGEKPSKTKGHKDYKDWFVLLDEATRPVGASSFVSPTAPAAAAPAAADGDDGFDPESF